MNDTSNITAKCRIQPQGQTAKYNVAGRGARATNSCSVLCPKKVSLPSSAPPTPQCRRSGVPPLNPLCDPSFPRPATFLNLLKYLTLFLGPSLGLTINCASPRYSLLGLHPSAFPPGGSFSPSLTIHKALHSLSTHLPQTHCPGSHLSPRLELPSCFEHLSNSLPAAPAPLGPGPGPLPALL